MTRELMAEQTFEPFETLTKTVDLVHNVLNYVPVHWAATRVASTGYNRLVVLEEKAHIPVI